MFQQGLRFYMMVFGKLFLSHLQFMERLKKRVHLKEVNSEDESDVIIAFVAVASRAGTDIEAALVKIPQSFRPVVLVVLHHTFDSEFVPPVSSLSVNRENVFTVDLLFHEDLKLLRCLQNDEALKKVADQLLFISNRTSDQTELLPGSSTGPTRKCCTRSCTLILILIIIAIAGITGFVIAILHILGDI